MVQAWWLVVAGGGGVAIGMFLFALMTMAGEQDDAQAELVSAVSGVEMT